MNWKKITITGCALFSMLFGAGNIIFPLILGRELGTAAPYAMIGFFITGVLLPLIGFISIIFAKGDFGNFLQSLGSVPAFLIASLCMILLGPIGAIPRCIAIAHADLAFYFPSFPISVFSVTAALILYLCTYKKVNMINIIGRYLGPIKILCLLSIAVLGVFGLSGAQNLQISPKESFVRGLFGGFGTLDLLAILFFSQFIFIMLTTANSSEEERYDSKKLLKNSLAVSAVAGILMTTTYCGFVTVAVGYSSLIGAVANDTLLSALASVILGKKAGLLANIAIIISCLTTAIALTASFTDFLCKFIFNKKLPYQTGLIFTIITSAFFSNFKFAGIMKIIMPPINLFYPALSVFAILYVIFTIQKKESKIPKIGFFSTLAISGGMKLIQFI